MKRSSFLKFPLVAAPLILKGQSRKKERLRKSIKVAAGQDCFKRQIKFGGAYPNSLKVSGKDTTGDLCFFEGDSDRKGGPPLHLHHEQDEIFYVVQGKFHFKIGDETFELNAGDCLFAPRKIPHAFANISEGKSKIMTIFQPAGQMEAFFQEVGKLTGKPSPKQFQNRFKDHGMEVVGPPLDIRA